MGAVTGQRWRAINHTGVRGNGEVTIEARGVEGPVRKLVGKSREVLWQLETDKRRRVLPTLSRMLQAAFQVEKQNTVGRKKEPYDIRTW